MALHSRDAVTVSAAVATRSRADCSSMEGHTSLSTALVRPSMKCFSLSSYLNVSEIVLFIPGGHIQWELSREGPGQPATQPTDPVQCGLSRR